MNQTILVVNVDIYTPEEIVRQGSVIICDGKIENILSQGESHGLEVSAEIVDGKGGLLLPGFIDLHVHGGGGFDVMDGTSEAIRGMCRYHAAYGTTALLPTTLTADQTQLKQVVRVIADMTHAQHDGAEVLGVHLEGPFLNPKRCGAQNPIHMRSPSLRELAVYIEQAKGHIRLMTIAPELVGAQAVIAYAVSKGITVSLGHTDASYDQVKEAAAWGASHITNLFNGMRPLHHRDPGVAGGALLVDDLTVELICDGIHVHPEVFSLVLRQKPRDRVVFITDSIAAAGLPDGDYQLSGLPVRSSQQQVRLLHEDGRLGELAGSSLTMLNALRNGLAFTGLSLHDLLPLLTLNPAKQIGVQERKGSIEIGKDADLLLLNPQFHLCSTFVKGRRVYSASSS